MEKIKACLFDLDGVVVDTAKYHFLAWKRLADELGFEFTLEHNERLKGVSRMTSLDILLEIGNKQISEDDKIAFADKKNKWYREFILKMEPDEILPGAIEFFEELKKANYKIALGSASKNALTILERTNILHWFDAIIDGTKTQKAKPDPEVFLLGAKAVNVKPEQCVVFEDAEAGVEAAIAAGMRCIGIGDEKVLYKANFVIPGLHKMSVSELNF